MAVGGAVGGVELLGLACGGGGVAVPAAVPQGAEMHWPAAQLLAEEALVVQLIGVRAFVPSLGLLLSWPELTTTAPAGVASFLKALLRYFACVHRSKLRGKPSIRVLPIRRCWRLDVMSLLRVSFMEMEPAGGKWGEGGGVVRAAFLLWKGWILSSEDG